MKQKTITALSAAALLASLSASHAGTPVAPPALPPAAAEEPAFTAEVSLGYDTFYIFRGEELFEQVVWGQVEMNFALTDSLSFTLTPWYLSGIDDDYTELDVLPSVTWDAGFAEITAGYAGYIYPRGSFGGNEGIDDEHEANLTIAKGFGFVEVSAMAAYNFDRDGTYLELGVSKSFELCAAAALDLSVAVGYSANYFSEDGFTHVLVTLGLPIKLTETATLTPYIAGNLPLEVLDENQDNEIFGGVALAVSF
jgi:hypothetical protein